MGGDGVNQAWYEVAFGELYPILYSHRDDTSARKEVEFAIKEFRIGPDARVLDLACGAGRHQRALGPRCAWVVGLDLSGPLLRENKNSGEARLVRADMRALPFADGSFDVVTSFFTSFGYFDSDSDDLRVLAGVHRVLRPGGGYLLDYLYAPRVAENLVRSSDRLVAGHRLREERRIDEGRVKKRVNILPPEGGQPVVYEESVRLYEPDDLREMAERSGFIVNRTYGSLDGEPLGVGERCVLSLERPR